MRRLLLALGFASVVAVFALETRAVGDFKIDDAYITFSFSKNLAAGNGPIYSHGIRVEGYSNFLWMSLIAGPLVVRPDLDLLALARALTIPFLLLLGLATLAIARRAVPWPWAWGALLLLAAHGDLAAAALSGMETVAYTALLALAFAVYLRAPGYLAGDLVIPCFVLVALMRVDGCIPLGFIVAWEVVGAIRARSFSLGALARWAVPGLGVYAAWFAWRWWYYGLLLPTPYYAKAAIPAVLPGRGAEYAWEAVATTGAWAAAPFIALAVVRSDRRARALAAFAVVHVVYVISVGGDWMPFGRFFLPIAPLLVVLFVQGMREALGAASGRLARTAVAAACAGAFGVVAVRLDRHVIDTAPEREKAATIGSWTARVEEGLLPGVRLLALMIRPGETLLTDYAGVFAVYTSAAVIDLFGICNTAVATRGSALGADPLYGRFCPVCYAEAEPRFLHVMPPLVRAADAFADHDAVIQAVFRGPRLAEPLDLQHGYVAGRVLVEASGRAVHFLERRRAGADFHPRTIAPGITVDYPFARN